MDWRAVLGGNVRRLRQERGLTHLHGDMLAENYPMRRVLRGLGLPITTTIHSGEIHVIIGMPQREEMLSHAQPPRMAHVVA